MPRRTADLMIVFASMIAATAARASDPPPVFIDKGACPFECCTYRLWMVARDTALYDSVNGRRMVGMARRGMRVQGITGQVHTVPLKARLTSGKEVWMLTYLGEGVWKTWDNGAVRETDDEALGKHARPRSTWWVRIKLPNGVTGWTKATQNFGNMDACG